MFVVILSDRLLVVGGSLTLLSRQWLAPQLLLDCQVDPREGQPYSGAVLGLELQCGSQHQQDLPMGEVLGEIWRE